MALLYANMLAVAVMPTWADILSDTGYVTGVLTTVVLLALWIAATSLSFVAAQHRKPVLAIALILVPAACHLWLNAAFYIEHAIGATAFAWSFLFHSLPYGFSVGLAVHGAATRNCNRFLCGVGLHAAYRLVILVATRTSEAYNSLLLAWIALAWLSLFATSVAVIRRARRPVEFKRLRPS